MIDKFIEVARSMVGVPYKHHGRSRQGVDCVGLIVVVAEELGIELQGHTDYKKVPNPDTLLKGILTHCTRTRGLSITPGNIALMEFSTVTGATHVGIITDLGILHAHEVRGYVAEHRINDQWRKRIKATFSINEFG